MRPTQMRGLRMTGLPEAICGSMTMWSIDSSRGTSTGYDGGRGPTGGFGKETKDTNRHGADGYASRRR